MRTTQELHTALRALKIAGAKATMIDPLEESVEELASLRAYLADLSRFMVYKDHVKTMMTDKQREVLDLIRDETRKNGGTPPSLREIADALGRSQTTIFEHVGVLIRRGLLIKVPNKTRGLFLTGAALVLYGEINDKGDYCPADPNMPELKPEVEKS